MENRDSGTRQHTLLDGEDVLYIRIEPINKSEPISIYHAGLGLVAIQRILNRALELDEDAQQHLGFLTPEQRRQQIALTFDEVHISSVDIRAMIGKWIISNGLPFASSVASGTISNVVGGVILDLLALEQRSPRQIEIDPLMLPSMEELARSGVSGRITFEVSHKGVTCKVTRKTLDAIQALRAQSGHNLDHEEAGTVYGSNMRERRIDIYLDSFAREIPCYYRPEQAEQFRKCTTDGTRVSVSGSVIWGKTSENHDLPVRINLHNIRKLPRNNGRS